MKQQFRTKGMCVQYAVDVGCRDAQNAGHCAFVVVNDEVSVVGVSATVPRRLRVNMPN